jgi:hypothetical protein
MVHYLLLHWHEAAYLLLATMFIGIYIVHFLPGLKDSKLKKLLEAETILMVILVFVAIIAARVETVSNEMERRDRLTGDLVDRALREKGLAKFREINSATELFAALNAARDRASKEIRITQLQAKTAGDLTAGETGRWYQEAERWLDAAPGRILYRVVGVANEEMERWFEDQCSRHGLATNRGLKKILGGRDLPRLNLVIFDRREVFMVASPLSGPAEAMQSLHVEDPDFANYFAAYYDKLFAGAGACGAGR